MPFVLVRYMYIIWPCSSLLPRQSCMQSCEHQRQRGCDSRGCGRRTQRRWCLGGRDGCRSAICHRRTPAASAYGRRPIAWPIAIPLTHVRTNWRGCRLVTCMTDAICTCLIMCTVLFKNRVHTHRHTRITQPTRCARDRQRVSTPHDQRVRDRELSFYTSTPPRFTT